MGLVYGTVFVFFYALFSLPLGRLADGWVRTRLLAITIFFRSVATELAAFAGGFALLALFRLAWGLARRRRNPPAPASSMIISLPPTRTGHGRARRGDRDRAWRIVDPRRRDRALMGYALSRRWRAVRVPWLAVRLRGCGAAGGPYIVGMVSDATGNLGHAILTVNWVAIPIVVMLVILALRVRRDHAGLTGRARSAGEPI